MRINIQQVVDGVNYHAEVESLEAAQEFQKFLKGITKEAFGPREPQTSTLSLTPLGEAVLAAAQAPSQVKAEAQGQKWTRENLQPVVVTLAKQREKFMALLQQFGVARFRDLPDDKLNDFGMACENSARAAAVAA